VFLCHKIQIVPSLEQIQYLNKAFGCRRKAYNEALESWKTTYNSGEKTNWKNERNKLVARKDEEFPFFKEVSYQVLKNAVEDLGNAFKGLFKKRTKYPKFKSKHKKNSFRIVREVESSIRFPSVKHFEFDKKCGPLKLKEELRFKGTVKQVTISKIADKYFASFMIDVKEHKDYYEQTTSEKVTGIDLGISKFATFPDGSYIDKCNALIKHEAKLKKLQRKLSKKKKGSIGRLKAKTKLSKLHYRISCIREDFLHQITTYLTKTYSLIKIEDLNIKGMIKNHKLAKHIAHSSFYRFKEMLSYKAKLRGVSIGLIDRFYPSSKLCSNCGQIKDEMKLSERIYICDCGFKIDRDHNAAINIMNFDNNRLKFI
jgi:putative transposase